MVAITSNLSDVSVIGDEWCRTDAFSWIEYKPWKPKLLWLLVSSLHFNLFLSLYKQLTCGEQTVNFKKSSTSQVSPTNIYKGKFLKKINK
ncbi:hypothetical protein KFK09_013381 [Dendrobium nobile]|uniref:Uncharacterized protein n=1 Tax=Dendrobium nobile TaxID=94219 RepID=A0A8T3BCX5_DENNO|nr:hypothetical protein KFK09_013381 [Dendrobium nobile]